MDYYFISGASSAFGPANFAIWIDCHNAAQNSIAKAIDAWARARGEILCHDWKAQPISEAEYDEIMG